METDNKSEVNPGTDTELFEAWVQKNYGGNSRTKTITSEKYERICKLIRGDDAQSNAKFRFWVKKKGFRLLRHEKVEDKDEVHDDPCGSLFVSLHAKDDNTAMREQSIETFLRTNLPAISFFRKVAIVEDFFGIIKSAHVDDKGVHAGQKKTYRLVSDTYAFLPREVITFYLLNCNTCKPRIQKYGPINSKVRLNNLNETRNATVERSNIERTSSTSSNESFSNESKTYASKRPELTSTQVIRPSPKRYRPTFVDQIVSESYSNTTMYESRSRNIDTLNGAVTTQVHNGSISSGHVMHDARYRPSLLHGNVHCAKKQISHMSSESDIGKIGKVKCEYSEYPFLYRSSSEDTKEARAFQDYKPYKETMRSSLRDDVRSTLETGPVGNVHNKPHTQVTHAHHQYHTNSIFSPTVITTPTIFRSKYNASPIEIVKEVRSYAGRMHPYKLHDRIEKLHERNDKLHERNEKLHERNEYISSDYKRYLMGSDADKDIMAPKPCYLPQYYGSLEGKGDGYSQGERRTCKDVPSPSLWRETLSTSCVADSSERTAWESSTAVGKKFDSFS